MTSALASSLDFPQEQAATPPRRESKAEQRKKLERVSEVMVREEGLFNVAQSAIFLDVSRDRVYELLDLKMLTKYEVLGRIYISFKELKARRAADVKAGRPPRTLGQKVKIALKTTVKTDFVQFLNGGPFPSEETIEEEKRRAKRKK